MCVPPTGSARYDHRSSEGRVRRAKEAGVQVPSARVAVERDRTESRDLAEVEHLITMRYVNNRPRLVGRTRELVFRSQAAWAGSTTVDHMTYGSSVAVNADPFSTILL